MDNLGLTITEMEQIAGRLARCAAAVVVASDELSKAASRLSLIINDNPEAFAVPLAEVYKLREKDHTPTNEHTKVAKD